MHVTTGEKLVKFWLDPVELTTSKRLRSRELVELQAVVEQHRDAFLEAWHAHFDP